jgi:amidase
LLPEAMEKHGASTTRPVFLWKASFLLKDFMKLRVSLWSFLVVLTVLGSSLNAQTAATSATKGMSQDAMDRDLLEVTVPQLEEMYRNHKYTVSEVLHWYMARIAKYNGIYRAVQNLDLQGALDTAAREDAEAAAGGSNFHRGPLWGVPIVTKANTSVKGLITTDGWRGYMIPGHELIAPKDATIVAKLRAAGAIIVGQTNMPDFAASDTNRSTAYGRTGNAYDVRFSPGGSSGGTVTAVTSNMAVLGNGTDTGNSIRMPSATSSVVGIFPTRGLVSIAGIAPLDWMLDNTGPIARNVTDAVIALDVMAGEDLADSRTLGSKAKAEPGPYTQYLKADALKGKRFGVPVFILAGAGIPFQGIPASATPAEVARATADAVIPLRPETREAFMKAIEGLRAAGATVVFDDSILPDSFAVTVARVATIPYIREGTEKFLAEYGPAQYHSSAEYEKTVGSPLPGTIISTGDTNDRKDSSNVAQALIENDPQADANYFTPRQRAIDAYNATLDRLRLDGYVYPATQMPPPDETMPQDGGISGGPHSDTSWVNMIGVPAVVVPGGFYPGGLPFGLEISARPWKDGDLLGWAYAYEQATKHRKPPVLIEQGLLPNAR